VAASQLPTVPISPNSMAKRAVSVTQSGVAMVASQRAIVSSVNTSTVSTRPAMVSSVGSESVGSGTSGSNSGGGSMSSNMTPDTAKLKGKNFLATLLH